MRACRKSASASLHISVSATDDAGEKVYVPPTWQSLKSSIATTIVATSTQKAPVCCA